MRRNTIEDLVVLNHALLGQAKEVRARHREMHAGLQAPDRREESDVREASGRQDWVVIWSDRADGRAYRDHSRSRGLALRAACDLIAQQHTVQRIIGPEG
jgi:hypothetical protein